MSVWSVSDDEFLFVLSLRGQMTFKKIQNALVIRSQGIGCLVIYWLNYVSCLAENPWRVKRTVIYVQSLLSCWRTLHRSNMSDSILTRQTEWLDNHYFRLSMNDKCLVTVCEYQCQGYGPGCLSFRLMALPLNQMRHTLFCCCCNFIFLSFLETYKGKENMSWWTSADLPAVVLNARDVVT